MDISTIIATNLTEVIRAHADELLSRQDVQKLLDRLAQNYPKVVEELVPNILSLGLIQKVLQNLLRERVSIRDLLTIMETMADSTGDYQRSGHPYGVRPAEVGPVHRQTI